MQHTLTLAINDYSTTQFGEVPGYAPDEVPYQPIPEVPDDQVPPKTPDELPPVKEPPQEPPFPGGLNKHKMPIYFCSVRLQIRHQTNAGHY